MDLDKDFNPLSMGQCNLSHLLFVDNLLVVGKIDYSSACFLKAALVELESHMGLSINQEKSIIYGGHNLTQSSHNQQVVGHK